MRYLRTTDRLTRPFRRVATFALNSLRIDVDWIGGRGGGPGFSFEEVRVFVAFELRGWSRAVGSSVMIGGRRGPAGALLRDAPGDALALVVSDDCRRVLVRTAHEPGTRRQRLSEPG